MNTVVLHKNLAVFAFNPVEQYGLSNITPIVVKRNNKVKNAFMALGPYLDKDQKATFPCKQRTIFL